MSVVPGTFPDELTRRVDIKRRTLQAGGAAVLLAMSGFAFVAPATAAESLNGNGQGLAVGRPDAGSVGNADNKSPKGQSDNDKNKGYECDDNAGVGRSNPAHTPSCEEIPR